MASAPNVLDTAISVTSAGSRPASRQARTIRARTPSRPIGSAAPSMRCLYRTRRHIATSNKRTRYALIDSAAGNVLKGRAVNDFKYAIFPTDRFCQKQTFKCLVGMHQRHSQRIGDVLLGERKLDGRTFDQACLLCARKKMQQ